MKSEKTISHWAPKLSAVPLKKSPSLTVTLNEIVFSSVVGSKRSLTGTPKTFAKELMTFLEQPYPDSVSIL